MRPYIVGDDVRSLIIPAPTTRAPKTPHVVSYSFRHTRRALRGLPNYAPAQISLESEWFRQQLAFAHPGRLRTAAPALTEWEPDRNCAGG
jgi:hypothetical protein